MTLTRQSAGCIGLLCVIAVLCVAGLRRCGQAAEDASAQAECRLVWSSRASLDPETAGRRIEFVGRDDLVSRIRKDDRASHVSVWMRVHEDWQLLTSGPAHRVAVRLESWEGAFRPTGPWTCRMEVQSTERYQLEVVSRPVQDGNLVKRSDVNVTVEVTTSPLAGASVRLVAGEQGPPLEDSPRAVANDAGLVEFLDVWGTEWWADVEAPGHCPIRTRVRLTQTLESEALGVEMFRGRDLRVSVRPLGTGCRGPFQVSTIPEVSSWLVPLHVPCQEDGGFTVQVPILEEVEARVWAIAESGESVMRRFFGYTGAGVDMNIECRGKPR